MRAAARCAASVEVVELLADVRKTCGPTNVRASVGSSASGSSPRPMVSVPPFLSWRGLLAARRRRRCGRRASARPAATPTPTATRIAVAVHWPSLPWVGIRTERGAETLPDWIPFQRRLDPNRVRVADMRERPSDTKSPSMRPSLAVRGPKLLAIGIARRCALGPAGGRRRHHHGAAARAVGGLRRSATRTPSRSARSSRSACGHRHVRASPARCEWSAGSRRSPRARSLVRGSARGSSRGSTSDSSRSSSARFSSASRRYWEPGGDAGRRSRRARGVRRPRRRGLGTSRCGGGTLVVPFLTLAVGLSQHSAEATSLVVILPTAVVASLALRRRGIGELGTRTPPGRRRRLWRQSSAALLALALAGIDAPPRLRGLPRASSVSRSSPTVCAHDDQRRRARRRAREPRSRQRAQRRDPDRHMAAPGVARS